MAQKTLAPNLIAEDKKVGVTVCIIGIVLALFIGCTVFGMVMYNAAFYGL